jgi:hypothetical protein
MVVVVVKYYTVDEGRNEEWLVVDFAAVMNIEDWGSEVIGYLLYYCLKVLLSEGGGGEVSRNTFFSTFLQILNLVKELRFERGLYTFSLGQGFGFELRR